MRLLCSSRNGCAGVPRTRVAQFPGIGHHQQPIQLRHVVDAGLVRLPRDGAEERARVAAPASIRALVIRDERARQLLDVVGALDFGE